MEKLKATLKGLPLYALLGTLLLANSFLILLTRAL